MFKWYRIYKDKINSLETENADLRLTVKKLQNSLRELDSKLVDQGGIMITPEQARKLSEEYKEISLQNAIEIIDRAICEAAKKGYNRITISTERFSLTTYYVSKQHIDTIMEKFSDFDWLDCGSYYNVSW